MNTIILVGFEPYSQFSTNLSGEIVNKFSIQDDRFSIVKKTIPVSWKRSITTYKNLLSKLPSKSLLIIILGIHQRNKFHLEKLGWNFIMGKDIDNKFRFGPIKYFSYPWIKSKLNLNKLYSILEKKICISISHFAGYYLCNYLYYWALYLSKKEYPVIFIHIPSKGNLVDLLMKVKMTLRIIIKLYLMKKL